MDRDRVAPPDSHHLRAAEGWLDLGNPIAAINELERIRPDLRVHPDVLSLRWNIYAIAGQWEASFEVSKRLCHVAPRRASSWVWRAKSLYMLNRTAEAYQVLRKKLPDFPNDMALHYDLARYACRLGKLEQARRQLRAAVALGDAHKVEKMARTEPDLKALWSKKRAR